MKGSSEQQLEEILGSLVESLNPLDDQQKEQLKQALEQAHSIGEADKEEKEIYLNHLMEHLPDRIYFKDLKSRFIMGNRAFIEYFGMKRNEDVAGKTDFDFFPEVFAKQKFEDEQRIIREGRPVQKDEHDEQKHGPPLWSSTTKMPLTDDDGNIIGTFGLSRDITDKKLAEEKLITIANDLRDKNEQIETDLAMARKLQTAFIPTSFPSFIWDMSMNRSALQFTHRYVPSAQLAGDFFQVIPISKSKAGVLICDVMGHGIRASLVTAILRGLVGELKLITPYPHVFLRKVNRSLNSILTQLDITLFITAFYGVIDLERASLHYSNAGHPTPLRVERKSKKVEWVPPVSDDPDPALGLVENYRYAYNSIPLAEQDALVFYTDGIPERENPQGEEFGNDRLVEVMKHLNDRETEAVLDELLTEVDAFSEGKSAHDDMCIVCVDIDRVAGPGD